MDRGQGREIRRLLGERQRRARAKGGTTSGWQRIPRRVRRAVRCSSGGKGARGRAAAHHGSRLRCRLEQNVACPSKKYLHQLEHDGSGLCTRECRGPPAPHGEVAQNWAKAHGRVTRSRQNHAHAGLARMLTGCGVTCKVGVWSAAARVPLRALQQPAQGCRWAQGSAEAHRWWKRLIPEGTTPRWPQRSQFDLPGASRREPSRPLRMLHSSSGGNLGECPGFPVNHAA